MESDKKAGRNGDLVHRAMSKKPEKLKEACLLMQKAQRNTQRRWKNGWKKPQFFKAGQYYNEAAKIFCQADDEENGRKALKSSYDCFKRSRAWYNAAKTLEQVVNLDLAAEKFSEELSTLAQQAALVFEKSGHPDSAGYLLEKVARVLEPEAALKMLKKAVEIVELEDRPIQAAIFVQKMMKINLEREEWNEAADNGKKTIQLYQETTQKASYGRSVLTTLLILVCDEQLSEAERIARENGNNCNVEQMKAMDLFVCGCEENDTEKIQKALANPSFASLKLEHRILFDHLQKAYNLPDPKSSSSEEDEDTLRKKKISRDMGIQINIIAATTNEAVMGTITEEEPKEVSKKLSKSTDCKKRSKLTKRNTIAHISVPNDLEAMEAARASNLVPSSLAPAYADITGFDVIEPRFQGMTVDQWREYKRNQTDVDYTSE